VIAELTRLSIAEVVEEIQAEVPTPFPVQLTHVTISVSPNVSRTAENRAQLSDTDAAL
jgi:hypothetical protein